MKILTRTKMILVPIAMLALLFTATSALAQSPAVAAFSVSSTNTGASLSATLQWQAADAIRGRARLDRPDLEFTGSASAAVFFVNQDGSNGVTITYLGTLSSGELAQLVVQSPAVIAFPEDPPPGERVTLLISTTYRVLVGNQLIAQEQIRDGFNGSVNGIIKP